MILIINICKEKLHYYEYVKPIEDILQKEKQTYTTKHYQDIQKKDIEKAKKIIITGTSIQDNNYQKDSNKFSWIKNYNKPILGICAGMQIIGQQYKGTTKKKTEIGYYKEQFKKKFLGLQEEQEVYHLHQHYTTFNKEFKKHTKANIPQAIKHKKKPTYGTLFHPEVRNKKIIINFTKL